MGCVDGNQIMTKRIYGDDTIHGTKLLNVEVDSNGRVVAVWFRCQPLPFDQMLADDVRSRDMDAMYATLKTDLLGVALEDN